MVSALGWPPTASSAQTFQSTPVSYTHLDVYKRQVVELKPEIFYQVLSEQTGLEIGDEAGLMPCILELAHAKREYEKVRIALELSLIHI